MSSLGEQVVAMKDRRPSSGEKPVPLLLVLKEMDKRYEQRFEAMDRGTATALASAKEAVLKAENSAEKRFEGLNELRGVVNDILGKTMPRTEAEAEYSRIRDRQADHTALDQQHHAEANERIAALDKKIDVIVGQSVGHKDTQATFRANVAMVVSAGIFLLTIIMWLSRMLIPTATAMTK